ncbi:hypothetical protein ABT158_45160 [Nonomuraea sp. NPDC001636]|uniref:hypothetical protein n=1 Tax=Nonomuraea sp. NPDC001636 TaxID=3154391 RepID=UPI00331EA3F1
MQPPAPAPADGTPGPLPDVAQYTGIYRTALAADMTDLGKLGSLTSTVTVSATGEAVPGTSRPRCISACSA